MSGAAERLLTIAGSKLQPNLTASLRSGTTARRTIAAAAREWTQRVGGYAALPMLIREFDVDPVATLAAAELAADALATPEAAIAYTAFGRLLHVAAERTGCGHLGLLAGRMLRLSDLGRLGEAIRARSTVRDALQTLTACQHADSEGALMFLIDGGATIELGYAIYHPYVSGTDQIHDAALAAMNKYLAELCGERWVPTEVLIPHARRADDRPYRSLFRTHPRFNAEVCAIRFPSRWMDRPIAGAAAAPRVVATRSPGGEEMPDLLQQVFRALRRLLVEGSASGDEVARAINMNRRTLNRRLEARGTTFQCVLDEMRFGLARQLLSTSEIALDDVAANLGYSGTSPFMRTFNRWAGTTPGRWRRIQVVGGAAPVLAD